MPLETAQPNLIPGHEISVEEPSAEEVIQAISTLKTRKSPGTCDIPAEALKALDEHGVLMITRVIQCIWRQQSVPQDFKDSIIVPIFKKGAVADCSNYRGISLLSIAGKILTGIIRKRLEDHYEAIMRDQQAGFRRGRGCTDQIFAIRQALERRIRYGKPTVVCFIDFAAAFDSIHRASMWKVLASCGIPDIYIKIIRDMYEDGQCRVRTQDGLSPPFSVRSGVRQGCILSPVLFNFVLHHVMASVIQPGASGITLGSDGFMLADLAYADDIALFQPDNHSMQQLLDRLAAVAGQIGMRIKPAKTKAMAVHTEPPNLTIYGEAIEAVDNFCYLGSIIGCDKISPESDVTTRIAKASAMFGRIDNKFWRRLDISLDLKMRIFNACILPVLLYGCESWALKEEDARRLEVFHMRCLRQILGLSLRDRVPNTVIRQRCCNQPTIELRCKKARLRWLGHVIRMPHDRICSQFWTVPLPPGWKCIRNAPRKTWRSMVLKDLQFLNDSYRGRWWGQQRDAIISDIARDRSQWREVVRGICRQ